MAEPTERYGLTDTEWAVAEILHRGCWCEAEHDLYADEGMTYGGCGPWSRGSDAREILAEINGPDPDWADVREAARNAGITFRLVRHEAAEWSEWIITAPGCDIEYRNNIGDWIASVSTSDAYANRINPSPAQVLDMARLVGLGGGDE